MKAKETNLFDKLDNVLGNYMEGKATALDVVNTANNVNSYLLKNPHPHDLTSDSDNLCACGEVGYYSKQQEKYVCESCFYENMELPKK